MNNGSVESLGYGSIIALLASFVGILALLLGLMILNMRKGGITAGGSPYSPEKLIYGIDIAQSLVQLIDDFMSYQPQPENAPFDMSNAAICRTTGRIFPDCVEKGEIIRLDWTFLQNRFPGNYVSWGALPEDEQARIRLLHGGFIEGYQTDDSSKHLLPQDAEEYYKLLAPGPLYVDRMKGTLIGWKSVPGTNFEVLVVQKSLYKSIEETL